MAVCSLPWASTGPPHKARHAEATGRLVDMAAFDLDNGSICDTHKATRGLDDQGLLPKPSKSEHISVKPLPVSAHQRLQAGRTIHHDKRSSLLGAAFGLDFRSRELQKKLDRAEIPLSFASASASAGARFSDHARTVPPDSLLLCAGKILRPPSRMTHCSSPSCRSRRVALATWTPFSTHQQPSWPPAAAQRLTRAPHRTQT